MFKLKSLLLFLGFLAFISAPFSSFADKSNESTKQYVKSSAITTDVKAHLLADPDVKSLHISVETENGVVTLTGNVETQDQIDKATAIVKKVDGVVSVKNKLKIKKTSTN